MHVGRRGAGEDGEDAVDDAGGRTPWVEVEEEGEVEGSADAATFSPHSTHSLLIHESSRSRPTPRAPE